MESEVSTAYCENLMNDVSVIEKCNNDGVCMRREVVECIKKQRYKIDSDFDKGKSVNQYLTELGYNIQMVIATQHNDFTTSDTVIKADYMRIQTLNGYPFIVYLDAKGYVETEGCVNDLTVLQDKTFCTDSHIKACYKICVPIVRGCALFTTNGFSTCMYNNSMKMIVYNHAYIHHENDNSSLLEVVVAYPILPLSELIGKNMEDVERRLMMVMEPLRKLILERAAKTSRDVCKSLDKVPKQINDFNTKFFERLECLAISIENLRETLKENLRYSCKCRRDCNCEAEKMKTIEITRYNIAIRERYFNEMIALYSAISHEMKGFYILMEKAKFASETLDDRYNGFDKTLVDPSTDWGKTMIENEEEFQ